MRRLDIMASTTTRNVVDNSCKPQGEILIAMIARGEKG